YRLLSEAEREYVTWAGTTTAFWWGETISTPQANYNGAPFGIGRFAAFFNGLFGSGAKGEYRQKTVPVNSFEPNPWALYNVRGNVWEWCEDVWHHNYKGAPIDGSAWLQGGDTIRRAVHGGSWRSRPRILRSAVRNWLTTDLRSNILGFRVARTLSP